MGKLLYLPVVALLVGAMIGEAHAADAALPPAEAADVLPPMEPLPPEEADPFGAGWYVRTSGGYGFAPEIDARQGRRDFSRSRIDGAAIALAGVGFKLNEFFRADVTLDHRFGGDFSGRFVCSACGIGGFRTFRDAAHLSATTALVNAYFDLPGLGAFTPYVGAGIGASYLSLEDYRASTGPGEATHGTGDKGDWNAAFALTAGLAFKVSDNLIVDAGYRFASLGDIRVHAPRGMRRRGQIEIDDITDQQVLIGIRYVFN